MSDTSPDPTPLTDGEIKDLVDFVASDEARENGAEITFSRATIERWCATITRPAAAGEPSST